MGFPHSSAGKESACSAGDLGLISGLRRFPGGGHGNPFWYSRLENPHGQRRLAGYSPLGHKEFGKIERLSTTQHTHTHTHTQCSRLLFEPPSHPSPPFHPSRSSHHRAPLWTPCVMNWKVQ